MGSREKTNYQLPERAARPSRPKWVTVLAAALGLVFLALLSKSFLSGRGKDWGVPGPQADGSFLLAGFESEQALKAWGLEAARAEIVPENAAEGKRAVKITFRGGGEAAEFSMSDYFESPGAKKDWASFKFLQFHVYNPRENTERLLFQIKDRKKHAYKKEFFIPGRALTAVAVPLEDAARAADLRNVDQVSFYLYKPGGDREFYLDDLRLTSAAPAASPADPQAVTPAGEIDLPDFGFSEKKSAWQAVSASGKPVIRVPFVVKNETPMPCQRCPVEGGIPFPPGELKNEKQVSLADSSGQEVPFQGRVLARWADGSVKWMAVHFKTGLAPQAGTGFFLSYGADVRPVESASPMKVEETPESLAVNTGVLRAVFSKTSFYLFDRVFLDRNADGAFDASEKLAARASLDLQFKKRGFRAELDNKTYRIEVEENGPERTVVRASGWYQSEDGERYGQALVRYYFYAGESYVRVSHTFIYTGYPENKYNRNQIARNLPPNETVDGLGLNIPFIFSQSEKDRMFLGWRRAPEMVAGTRRVEILQRNLEVLEVTREGVATPPTDLFAGWVDVINGTAGLSVAVRDFRENFPKAFRLDQEKGEVRIDLWPAEAGPLDLKTTSGSIDPNEKLPSSAYGFAKTHELLFYFHPLDESSLNVPSLNGAFMEPLVIRNNPYWVEATGAAGHLQPVTSKYAREEKILENLFDWAWRQPYQFRWFGMVDFGDTLTWWRSADESHHYGEMGWHPEGRWGWANCDGAGLHSGAFLQYLRSGQWKYFRFGRNIARHIMDVDTVHYDKVAEDARLSELNGALSKVGSMHCQNADHWGGVNDDASCTNVEGLLLYYYISGDERAWDVVREAGQFLVSKPYFSADNPEFATLRSLAGILWGNSLMYEATGEGKYREAADEIAGILQSGQQADGAFWSQYNPHDKTWGGTQDDEVMSAYLLPALTAYHEATGNAEAGQVLVRLARCLTPTVPGGELMRGMAYAYRVSGDTYFLDEADKKLAALAGRQNRTSDPLTNGTIDDKAAYSTATRLLFNVPYIFSALEEKKANPAVSQSLEAEKYEMR